MKIRNNAVLGRNWIKVDVTREPSIDQVAARRLERAFIDYPDFRVAVQSIEEKGAEKLRALIEREKWRDFYVAWRLLQLEVDRGKLRELFLEKCPYKGIEFSGMRQILPGDSRETLEGY